MEMVLFKLEKSGNSIEMEYKRKWYQPFGFFKRPKLTVYLPDDYQQDLAIEVGSGNVNSKDLHLNKLLIRCEFWKCEYGFDHGSNGGP